MRVIWSPAAEADLDEISRHIAVDNLAAALALDQRIRSLVANLPQYPMMGRAGRLARSRELIVSGSPYLVIYRAESADIEVLRIVHGAQAWPPDEAR